MSVTDNENRNQSDMDAEETVDIDLPVPASEKKAVPEEKPGIESGPDFLDETIGVHQIADADLETAELDALIGEALEAVEKKEVLSGKKKSRKKKKPVQIVEHVEPHELETQESLRQTILEQKRAAQDKHNLAVGLKADFENFRKRVNNERQALIDNAAEKIVLQMLPALDDMERSLEMTGDMDEHPVVVGMKNVFGKLASILANTGLEEMNTDGERFDPNKHDALQTVVSEAESGVIAATLQKGYFFRNKLIRPARVVVSKGPGDKSVEAAEAVAESDENVDDNEKAISAEERVESEHEEQNQGSNGNSDREQGE